MLLGLALALTLGTTPAEALKTAADHLEKDPGAAQELAQKGARAGVQPRGVPVIDIKGKLVLGYNEARIRQPMR